MPSTTGAAKFDKYFKGKGELPTLSKGKRGATVPVYEAVKGNKIVDQIPDAAPITVIPGSSYQGRYLCKYKNNKRGFLRDENVGKPKPPSVNSAFGRLTAIDFVATKKDTRFCYQDEEIQAKVFSSKDIEESIRGSIVKNPSISEGIEDSILSLMESNNYRNFRWDESVTEFEKKKLGVYFGEVLIGLLALKEKKSVISPVPWPKKPAQFIMPTDVSFSGVDSFLSLETGEIVPISSKAGTGAAASFFSNLLVSGIKNFKKLPNCVFRDIVEASIRTSKNGKVKAKQALYEFGIRNILKIPVREIRDTYSVFEDIRLKRTSDERNLVISKIANFPKLEQLVLQNLEESTTAFFSRTIADMLNSDIVSTDVMIKILSGKEYWQANLNVSKWMKGEVAFSMVKAGRARLQIVGNKSSVKDLNAPQGMVNYILTKV